MEKLEKYGVMVTATNREFLNIFKVLNETRNVKGVRYAKAVVINSKVIKDHLDPLEQLAVPTEDFINLSLEAQKFIQAEDSEGLKKFEEEHTEIIEKRKAQMQAVNEKLDEEATLELKLIAEACIPDDITAEQLDTLIKIIQ
jgi:hypothetical protein